MIPRKISVDTWIQVHVSKAMDSDMTDGQKKVAVETIENIHSWQSFMQLFRAIIRSTPPEARNFDLMKSGLDIFAHYLLIRLQGGLSEFLSFGAGMNADGTIRMFDDDDPNSLVPFAASQPSAENPSQASQADKSIRKGAHSTSYSYTCPFPDCKNTKISFPTVKEHLIHKHLNSSLKALLPERRMRKVLLNKMWRAAELVIDKKGIFVHHKAELLEVLLRRGMHLGTGIRQADSEVNKIVDTWRKKDVQDVVDGKERILCRRLALDKESEPNQDAFIRNLVKLGLIRKQRRKSRFSDPENIPAGYEGNVEPNTVVTKSHPSCIDSEDEIEVSRVTKKRKIHPDTAPRLGRHILVSPLAPFDGNDVNLNASSQPIDGDAAMFGVY